MVEPREQVSYRAVRVVGVLLMLQLVGLVAIGVYEFSSLPWDRMAERGQRQAQVLVQNVPKSLERQVVQAVLYVFFFLPAAILLLLAGLGFLLLRRRGWLLASVAQGLILLVCIFSFPEPRPGFTYLIIAYSVLMVLYLNSRDVRAVFHSRNLQAQREAEAAHEA